MLIRLTKSNYSLQLGLLILLALSLWVRNFMVQEPIEIIEPQTFLYDSLFGWTKTNMLLAKILTLMCVLLQAFMLSEMVRVHSISKNSMSVALIYVVLLSVQNGWQVLQPFMISNFFVIGGIWYLFKIYNEKEPYEKVFNASILFALASLFSASLLPFGFIVFWIFLFYPINQWREWLIAILGFGFPFFIVFLWATLTENSDVFSEFSIQIMNFDSLEKITELSLSTQIFVSIVLVLSLVGIGFMQLRAKFSEISQRKKITAMMLGIFWMVSVGLFTSYTTTHLATLFIFSAFFIAEWLYRNERKWLSELVFYGFLIAAFGVQYL
ncbi:MAG: hypothetical protein FWG79_05230 [Bacteroidales bacterium]|nr:hypothetical protein [Bacteroidales bacterium]